MRLVRVEGSLREMVFLRPTDRDAYHLFMVFDGHNGAEAGQHCAANFHEELHRRLPLGPIPDLSSAAGPDYETWCSGVRAALADAFLSMDMSFAERRILSGCTATVCLVVQWLCLVANVGDSSAVLDMGPGGTGLLPNFRSQT